MSERENLMAVADVLRKMAVGSDRREDLAVGAANMVRPRLVEEARLIALARTIEQALLSNAFEQPPTLREWRKMVAVPPDEVKP